MAAGTAEDGLTVAVPASFVREGDTIRLGERIMLDDKSADSPGAEDAALAIAGEPQPKRGRGEGGDPPSDTRGA